MLLSTAITLTAIVLCLSHAHGLQVPSAVRRVSGSPLDSNVDRGYTASWRSSRTDTPKVVFSAPSQLADDMRVEVIERAEGWRTLNLVGTKLNIMHGMARMAGPDGGTDDAAMPIEYHKSLVALALAGLEDGGAVSSPACLFIGLGAGSLPRFIDTHVPGATCVALELDGAVVEAARSHLGLDRSGVAVIVEDGVEWVKAQAQTPAPPSFDAVFIDIFDGQNDLPPAARSDAFLAHVHELLRPGGVVVHNLHFGSTRLNATLREAEAMYARTFGSVCRASALDVSQQTLLEPQPSLEPQPLSCSIRRTISGISTMSTLRPRLDSSPLLANAGQALGRQCYHRRVDLRQRLHPRNEPRGGGGGGGHAAPAHV
jgi:hypothetical protein